MEEKDVKKVSEFFTIEQSDGNIDGSGVPKWDPWDLPRFVVFIYCIYRILLCMAKYK